MNKLRSKRGQAVLELAIFGTLILVILSGMIGQLQKINDQQYVNMEAFRRALYHACLDNTGGTGAGSSTQYTLVHHRQHADASNYFRKGSSQILSSGASVSWAVPEIKEDAEAARLVVVNVDGTETVFKYRDYVSKDEDRFDKEGNERDTYKVFQVGNINFDSDLTFSETSGKTESNSAITTQRTSSLTNLATTDVQYEIVQKYSGSNAETLVSEGTLVKPTNTLTKSSSSTWTTGF